jgi:hypothetical protein
MIFNKKGYIQFCLQSCPNLKQLDMRKVTPEMREQSGVAALTGDSIPMDPSRSGAESTAAATSDYIDKI